MCTGRRETVEDGGVFWRWGRDAKIVEDAHKTFKTAIHGHNLSDTGRCGGEIDEMGEGVEERQRRVGVQRCAKREI